MGALIGVALVGAVVFLAISFHSYFVVIGACAVGSIAGWVLRSVFVSAEISRMQARMQHQVRRWQVETAQARSRAEQLARQLAAHTGVVSEEQHQSSEDDE
jgi:hypothetical protein